MYSRNLIVGFVLSGTVLLGFVASLHSAEPSKWLIETVAGTGETQRGADHGLATEVNIGDPFGVEIGPDGGLYITEVRNHRVWRIDLATKQARVVAGNGTKGYSGDGQLATAAQLNEPYEVRFDKQGNMYFVEMQNHLIRRVDSRTKTISTIAGTGKGGYAGDDGPATTAQFNRPHSIVLHGENLYVADIGNHRIRKIDLVSGTVSSIAGSKQKALPTDGQTALGTPVLGPRALFMSGDTMWVALREGHSVWKLSSGLRVWKHVSGTGKQGFSPAPLVAAQATYNGPKGIAVGPQGAIYVVDTENHAIRRIDLKANTVETIAGGGPETGGFAGDQGNAIQAKMNRPHGICVARDGSVFVGDTLNHRVRRIYQVR
jgi:sugar lactone lactonase YvrE